MRIAGFDAADLVGGLLVFAGGCAVALGATSYQIGELTRMGPGYFPMLVPSTLGLVILVSLAQDRPHLGMIAATAAFLIAFSIGVFIYALAIPIPAIRL